MKDVEDVVVYIPFLYDDVHLLVYASRTDNFRVLFCCCKCVVGFRKPISCAWRQSCRVLQSESPAYSNHGCKVPSRECLARLQVLQSFARRQAIQAL
jgi:hypothetical protein